MTTLFETLKARCPEAWDGYTTHAFVRGLADGTLPEASFKHYLMQDYLFLVQFARAYSLAGYKARTLADLRAAKDAMAALLDRELDLHVAYCAEWGISETDLAELPEATANMAYTRYVMERGMAGDLLDLHVALAPCVLGYGEIGERLNADPATKRDGNPYLPWIETYAGEGYQSHAAEATAYLDALAGPDLPESRLRDLARTFEQATRLEIGFWEMGLTGAW
jgi:thiaminase/transcriptional activator TenA